MTCTRSEELLADYCAGDLPAGPLRSELEAHLAACPTCRALGAALDDVLALLRAARDPLGSRLLEPPAGLAERAAGAAWRAGRSAGRAWTTVLPRRVQMLAAGLALLATSAVLAGHGALDRGLPQRMVRRAATAGVRLMERKDRAVEDLRMLRVMVAATFAGRMDQVSERVDDYRRLLERRRPVPAAGPEAAPTPGESRPPSRGPAAPGAPVSGATPESSTGPSTQSPNRGAPARV